MTIIINKENLTCYYLEQKFQEEEKLSGLKFEEHEEDEDGSTTTTTFNYKNDKDLAKKLNYILMMLTDK